jgi:hypothetical protein
VPATIETVVVVGVQVDEVEKAPADEALVRVTVVAAATFDGLPKLSWVWTDIADEHVPAITVTAELVKTSLAGAAGVTVSV